MKAQVVRGFKSHLHRSDLQECQFLAAARRVSRHLLAHLFGSVMSRSLDQPRLLCLARVPWTGVNGEAHAAEACAAIQGWLEPSADGRMLATYGPHHTE